ncbi:hypothetical protein AUEXF2481DRAFT_254402 [Aureobasidium subglaciale EXF-2481]|uniref:Uncharacterized protein n=1 Tax=Aureobasidium subglaciale (strain EXF-2481) TaxID=1043005 RepID=A0A074YAB5_AURSE|nr:uncharacterized protein AUEXF2481DRAFT_254402 [Aureobasidium subglaciale EXF-2481]KEQ94723.1 hypothetical protein AUEXF2481DRAFT_254402 [Aureobasidium subglaciale EXF-2481]
MSRRKVQSYFYSHRSNPESRRKYVSWCHRFHSRTFCASRQLQMTVLCTWGSSDDHHLILNSQRPATSTILCAQFTRSLTYVPSVTFYQITRLWARIGLSTRSLSSQHRCQAQTSHPSGKSHQRSQPSRCGPFGRSTPITFLAVPTTFGLASTWLPTFIPL